MFVVDRACGVVIRRLDTADRADLHPRLSTWFAAVLPLPCHPNWWRAGLLVAVSGVSSGFHVGLVAEAFVNHLAVNFSSAPISQVLFTSTARLGAVGPSLRGPLIGTVLYQDVVLNARVTVHIHHVLVRQIHILIPMQSHHNENSMSERAGGLEGLLVIVILIFPLNALLYD